MPSKQSQRRSKSGERATAFDQGKGVRRIARERVGTPPAAKLIEPKERRKKPKHKKPPGIDLMEE